MFDHNTALLRTVFMEFYPVLAAFCAKYVKNADVARDMVQDIFLKVLENIHKIDFSRPLHSYILKLAHNHCMDYLERLKVEKKYLQHAAMQLSEIDLQYDHLFEQLAADALQERIDQVVEKLPEQCRDIFCKSRYDGMSHQEIARELKISVRTVESHIYRALKVLKKALKDYF